ncbi:ABC-type methionine transport system, ATPase component [Arboricoccus pini]|uniref:Cell division ATP-binding protein FtsE n=1 Tax=Arboricoccus pini TaxID=1963835 RepID=A0A212RFS5_9PROT|nr:methionine ABC transporter ATP-binding protein [Arboricoccus pini]SNB71215.1 ABC-type methionine transport system, ATPase component [Arboricoccus pini]
MITITNLSKNFSDGDRHSIVLDAINLSVERGEILAVVGPSGAGKSTLARCINLLGRPSSGSIVVDGVELTGLRAAELRVARRSIGTIFQASHMLSRRTAAENIALPLEYMGVVREERDARVLELLERVGLAQHAHRYPHQLSGGQRQRVGIARALALRPSVLLADEATSGLDPDNVESVIALLRELRQDLGLTILMITHDMQMVRKIADRVARLSHGRIIESGPLLDLLVDPESQLGNLLLPSPSGEDDSIDGGGQVWRVVYGSDHVAPTWLAAINRALGAEVHLLTASIETIRRHQVGHATISLPANLPEANIRRFLSEQGLQGYLVASPSKGGREKVGERIEV